MKRAILAGLALALSTSLAFAAPPPGQLVSGYDYTGTQPRQLSVDSQGRLNVVGSASGSNVYGSDNAGAAGTHAPVVIGGTTTPGATGGTVYNWSINSSGAGSVTGTVAATQSGTWNIGTITTLPAVTQGTAANLNAQVVGNIASGATDSGNPVKIGGVYNSTLPTLTTGQRVDLQTDTKGTLHVGLYDASGLGVRVSQPGDGQSNAINLLQVNAFPELYNGTTWDRAYSIGGVVAANTGIAAVSPAPNSAAGAAITPIVSTAAESGHVLKASAGNLYRIAVTSTVAGYLLVFNATTVPADGAVTPQLCRNVPANQTVEVDHSTIPQRYTTGISAAFSTTGCFTKTASATAMFEGDVE